MWDALPIQRSTTAHSFPNFSHIDPDAKYAHTPKDPGVCCSRWRDVDPNVQQWALKLWIIHFGIRRCPLGPDDFFVWIPFVSTLAAKLGRWSATEHSTPAATIVCNFVDPSYRQRGAVKRMILTIARALYDSGNPVPFFELQNVPASMSDATPILQFSYVWIPPMGSSTEWVETAIDCAGVPGFHPTSWDGFRMFRNRRNRRRILVDPHDDIVWQDSIWDVLSANLPVSSKYVRWFSAHGNIRVYALNVHFTPGEPQSVLI